MTGALPPPIEYVAFSDIRAVSKNFYGYLKAKLSPVRTSVALDDKEKTLLGLRDEFCGVS